MLTEAGADVNLTDHAGYIALFSAVFARSVISAKVLLKAGIYINMLNSQCHNALQHYITTSESPNLNRCKLLFAAGERLNDTMITRSGRTIRKVVLRVKLEDFL